MSRRNQGGALASARRHEAERKLSPEQETAVELQGACEIAQGFRNLMKGLRDEANTLVKLYEGALVPDSDPNHAEAIATLDRVNDRLLLAQLDLVEKLGALATHADPERRIEVA